ncbi:COG1361 S-layer family protein [Candidatus Woesearchaeota archaeon]|nr:COG1361 S-layer family protein [Candidatus Woesearchaeota archaeon]
MRKTAFAMALTVMMMIGIVPAFGATPTASKLTVTLLNQDPFPAEPGGYVDVRFLIENVGTQQAEDVSFELIYNYPFSLDPGASAMRYYGSIRASADEDQEAIMAYRLRVDADAIDGISKLSLRYKKGADDIWHPTDDFDVRVGSSNAVISIVDVTADPSHVSPGDTVDVSMRLKNMVGTGLKDIKVSLGLSGTDVPFAPVDSTNEKVIKRLDPGKEQAVEFKLIAESDAASGVYKIPVAITYSDMDGEDYTMAAVTSLVVGSTPDLSVILDTTDIRSSGSKGEVTVKFVNRGLSDVKFVNVVLEGSDLYKVFSPTELYLGNIDSDDYETADFDLYIEKAASGAVTLPLQVTYLDPNNKEYSMRVELKVPLYTAEQLEQYGLVQKSGVGIYLGVVVVLVVGFVLWRRWRKKRRNHNGMKK